MLSCANNLGYVGLLEKSCDFRSAKFSCKLSKRRAVCIRAMAKSGKAFEKSCDPPHISMLDSVGDVAQFNRQVTASLPKVLDCPTRWRGAELAVCFVDLRAPLKQQLDNLSMSVKRRVMQSCRARLVSLMHEFAISVQDLADPVYISLRNGAAQIG